MKYAKSYTTYLRPNLYFITMVTPTLVRCISISHVVNTNTCIFIARKDFIANTRDSVRRKKNKQLDGIIWLWLYIHSCYQSGLFEHELKARHGNWISVFIFGVALKNSASSKLSKLNLSRCYCFDESIFGVWIDVFILVVGELLEANWICWIYLVVPLRILKFVVRSSNIVF